MVLITTAMLVACAAPVAPTAGPTAAPSESPAPPASPEPTPPPPTPTPIAYETPDWFKTAVVYQVFVRSFNDSNGDGIGDLDGITAKLDYIQSLGADTLWLTPIFASPSYHGYDTVDYYTINPDFGTEQDLIELNQAADARGMHILLDFVAAHTSNEHAWFQDAYARPESGYTDWYQFEDEKNLNYKSFFDIATLPSLNQTNPDTIQYFVDLAKYWLDPNQDGDFSDGIDGWRCDYALNAPHSFWRRLRQEVKAFRPDAVLLGEVWVRESTSLVPYYKDEFDALFDFPVYMAMMGENARNGDGVIMGESFVSIVLDEVDDQLQRFPEDSIRVRFMGNHDTDRIVTEVEGDLQRARLAAQLVSTLDGVPMLYYGEEIGMLGHKGGGPIYDEYRREAMDWYAAASGAGMTSWFSAPRYTLPDDGISVEEQEADPDSLLNFYRGLYATRAANPALRAGAYTPLFVNPRPNIWAFWRHTEDQVLAVVFNLDAQPATIALDLDEPPVAISAAPVVLGTQTSVDPVALTVPGVSAILLDFTP